MEKQPTIVPVQALSHSVEVYLSRSHRSTRIIYLIILGFVVISFALLFIIRTDVNVRTAGIIRSLSEKNEIRVASEGVIDSLFVKENSIVQIGQPLMKIRSTTLDEKNQALSDQYTDLENKVHDLQLLTNGKHAGLTSPVYQQQYNFYQQKQADAANRYNLALKNFKRFEYLYAEHAASALDYDKANFEKNAAASESGLVRQQQQTQWQAELNQLSTQLQQLKAQLGINEEYKSQYIIKAQVSGTVQGMKGVQPGSFVNPAEIIGEISPEDGLIAETYVLPKDIALIRAGNPVRFYIDAFDYTAWGDVAGIVQEVSPDVFTKDGQPFFKVRCKLDKRQLQLKNGYTGELKKGMTVQARFKIARRSLFELLYQETHDWLNPNTTTNGQTAIK
ncbi:MAG: HlyD family efflux transporter periplasmic adaptor subunit [Chitinophagaceae bacterium]|nr:HlyD family efflux transporter periplasmic adaptor subunit [Chitinophagaceae bacterium]